MLEGMYVNKLFMEPHTRPYPPFPQETSGYDIGSESIYRYSLKSSDYPTITIAEPLFDGAGEVIKPGHYELALSDGMDFLILLESKKPRAIIPVFKIEEDKSEQNRIKNRSYKRELKKEAKEREKTNAKRAKVGMPPDLPYVHMEASIEYDKVENYYLIKYQRGAIKAWGAFKG